MIGSNFTNQRSNQRSHQTSNNETINNNINSNNSNSNSNSNNNSENHQFQKTLTISNRNSPRNNRQNNRRSNDNSLNHLLGFTLAPRPNQNQSNVNSNGSRRPIRRHLSSNNRHDQELFVHAKYRFILKPTGDYTVHFADPDIRFNWPDVLQVIVNTSTSRPNLRSTTTAAATESSASQLDGHDSPELSQLTCPICLSPPTAPRMTKCGHIFCYPCVLHYLELSDEGKGNGRKCPVCWEAVFKKDLKSVKWFDCAAEARKFSRVGSDGMMCFRLIERPKFTTLALPRSPTWSSQAAAQSQLTPWHFTPDALPFVRFMLATPDYMIEELEQDLRELRDEITTLSKWSVGGKGTEDLSIMFARTAEKKVQEQIQKAGLLKTHFVMTARKKALRQIAEDLTASSGSSGQSSGLGNGLSINGNGANTSTDEEDPEVAPTAAGQTDPKRTTDPISVDPSPGEKISNEPPTRPSYPRRESDVHQGCCCLTSGPATTKVRKNVNPSQPISTTYRFYQSASGENVYLSSLDVRILLERFGSYDNFPDSITLRVEGYSEGRMNEELRRRSKYLSHLPIGSEVSMVEVDLDEYLVENSSLGVSVRQRRSKRRERVRKEDKAKAKSESNLELQQLMIKRSDDLTLTGSSLEGVGFGEMRMVDFPEARSKKVQDYLRSEEGLDHDPSSRMMPEIFCSSSRNIKDGGGSKTVWGTIIPKQRTEEGRFGGGLIEKDSFLGRGWEALDRIDYNSRVNEEDEEEEERIDRRKVSELEGVKPNDNEEDCLGVGKLGNNNNSSSGCGGCGVSCKDDEDDEVQDSSNNNKKKKKKKQKDKKVNKVVINISGGRGGRGT